MKLSEITSESGDEPLNFQTIVLDRLCEDAPSNGLIGSQKVLH